MKLLLTSGGITTDLLAQELIALAGKSAEETSVLFVPTAANPILEDKGWLMDNLAEFQKQDQLVERLLAESFSANDIASALIHQLQHGEGSGKAAPKTEEYERPQREESFDRRDDRRGRFDDRGERGNFRNRDDRRPQFDNRRDERPRRFEDRPPRAESKFAAPPKPKVVALPKNVVPLPEAKDDVGAASVPPPDIVLGLPDDKVALNLGNWSYDHKNFTLAAAYYAQAMSRGIDNADVRTDLGNAMRFSGDPAAALKQYQVAHAKSPSHENSLFNQGACYMQLGNTRNAVAIWQQYVTQFPHGEHADVARDLITQSSGLSSPPPK